MSITAISSQNYPLTTFTSDRSEEPLFESILLKSASLEPFLNHERFAKDPFIQFLFSPRSNGALPVLELSTFQAQQLLRWLSASGRSLDLRQIVEPQKTLFTHWATRDDFILLKPMLEIDKTLLKEVVEQNLISAALLTKKTQMATYLEGLAHSEGLQLTKKDQLLLSIYRGENPQEFLRLGSVELAADCYRAANLYFCQSFILEANSALPGLAQRNKTPEIGSIFSANMDAIDVRKAIRDFLLNLRNQGLLLSAEEFEKDKPYYKHKGPDIGRIFGRNYIESAAQRLNLTRIKVPVKVAVVEKDIEWKTYTHRRIELESLMFSCNLQIYAQGIKRIMRSITQEEFIQLITLITAIQFSDINLCNFIISDQEIYIIDTEWGNNFDGTPYSKLNRLLEFLAPEDREWGSKHIQSITPAFRASTPEEIAQWKKNRARQQAQLHRFAFVEQSGVFPVDSILGPS